MPHARSYGRRTDGTYAFPLIFKDFSPSRLQELLFDDSETDATPDTWITQTTSFILSLRAALGEDLQAVQSIEPTMSPEYSIRFIVDYDRACDVQGKLNTYLGTLPADLIIT